jgi:predicted AAA+ superfamily ATPase
MKSIHWNDRLLAIVGARGTGKTTMMLQYMKSKLDLEKSFYMSLDDLYFTNHRLLYTVGDLYKEGITNFFIDEAHKYPYETWAQELKNIYDSFPKAKVVFSGSSILDIYKGNADLSRRAISYELFGLSFREFLILEKKIKPNVQPISLEYLLKNHTKIASEIIYKFKILPLFRKYLQSGYYPYYKENLLNYHLRLQNTVNLVLDADLPAVDNIEYVSVVKLKRLLNIISEMVPFTPNMTKLGGAVEIQRPNLLKHLTQLERARMISLLKSREKKVEDLSKPEKIYLDNTNLAYAIGQGNTNIGNIRETFFNNQLRVHHKVTITEKGDFCIDNKYIFEIGGKNKDTSQIINTPNAYLALDEIELGGKNKIPLWLFGFLY